MQSVNVLSAERLIAMLIEAGSIQSLNYAAGVPPFSSVGTRLDLQTGAIETPNFAVDAAGNVTFTGSAIVGGDIRSANYAAGPLPPGYSVAGTRLDLSNGDLFMPGLYVNGQTGALLVRGDVTADTFTVPAPTGPPLVAEFQGSTIGLSRRDAVNTRTAFVRINNNVTQLNVGALTDTGVGGQLIANTGLGIVRLVGTNYVEVGTSPTAGVPLYPSGPQTSVSVSSATGWNVTVEQFKRFGAAAQVRINIERTGADISPGGTNTLLGTLDAAGRGTYGGAQPLAPYDRSGIATTDGPYVSFTPSSGDVFCRWIGGTWANGGQITFGGLVLLD